MNAATACTVAVAYTAAAVALIGYAATGPKQRAHLRSYARYHYTRYRYVRLMRGPLPERDQGIPYDRRAWLTILDAWEDRPAPPERTRT